MTEEQAHEINQGARVNYKGTIYTVASVRLTGIAAPYFRLNGVSDGPVSYRLCHVVADATARKAGDAT